MQDIKHHMQVARFVPRRGSKKTDAGLNISVFGVRTLHCVDRKQDGAESEYLNI